MRISASKPSRTVFRFGCTDPYLGLLTSNPQGRIDPTKDVVVNVLRWIPEQEPLKRQFALDGALLSRPFNQDDLEAFSYLPETDRLALYQWLIALPFVRSGSLDGRHSYHELVQSLFCRHLYQRSRKDYTRARKALADDYQHQMKKAQQEEATPASPTHSQGRSIHRSSEWLELAMAAAYQLFLLPDEVSQQKGTELILHAYEDTAQTEEIIRILRQLVQGQSSTQLGQAARHSIECLLGSIEADPPASRQWQELVKAADELLKTVTRTPTFSSELLAQLYRKRGFAYSRLRDYQRALAEFDRALELSPNYARAYASRGSVYRYLGVDQQAIDDASRAIDLKPRNAWAYAIRGHVYSLCQDYTQAIEDLSRAIEISSDYAYGNFLRGYISLWQGERERARADFAQNWQLNAKRVKVDWFIGWFSMNHKKPAEGDGTGSSRGILVIDLHRRGCSGSKTGLRMCWRC